MRNMLLLFLLFPCMLSAQRKDTLTLYFNQNWEKCAKDSATYFSKIFPKGEKWQRIDYSKNPLRIIMCAEFNDAGTKQRNGLAEWFNDEGRCFRKILYVWDMRRSKSWEKEWLEYYPDGKKRKGYILSDSAGSVLKSEMYDLDGKVIPDAIIRRQAEMMAPNSFTAFVRRNLRESVPVDNGAPKGKYSVLVRFTVEKDGSVSNITALNDPGYGTKEEALRIISLSKGLWRPAVMFNVPVKSNFVQKITFNMALD